MPVLSGPGIIGRDAIIREGIYAGRRARVTAVERIDGHAYYIVRPYRLHGRKTPLVAGNPYQSTKPRKRGEFRLILVPRGK